MTRSTLLHRRAALALCITAVSLDAGCAHFRNAEERAAAARAAPPPGEPALAEAPPPPTPAPYRAALQPAPAPAPLPEPAPSAPQPAPPPAAEQPRAAPEPAPPPQPVPPPQVAAREAIPEPVAPSPAPAAPAVDNTPSSVLGPATGDAIIVFANTPGAGCVTCETVKITVTPTGTVLMERGFWTGNHTGWHYKRSVHHVGAAPAAAFAASLNADRPVGAQALASSTSCAGSGDDGLAIEWIEADRHDRLTLTPSCPSGGNSQIAQRLRHAPDVLRLRGSPWPWETGAQTSSR